MVTTKCHITVTMLLCLFSLLGSGCGPSTPTNTEPEQVASTRTPFPTYTPTSVVSRLDSESISTAVTPIVEPTVVEPTAVVAILVPTPAAPLTTTQSITSTASNEEPTIAESTVLTLVVEATSIPTGARLTVASDTVNLRSGPDVAYPVVDVAAQDQQYPITGRNETADWWQLCCVADQPAWIYGPLVSVQNADAVAVVTDIPAPPAAVTAPSPETGGEEIATAPEPAPETSPETGNLVPGAPATHSGTVGNFDPSAQYQIIHYRVLGFDDNNGGIFSKGGQQFIFLTVLDQNGGLVDGAIVKDAVGDKLNVVTGSKGSGKAEIKMDWDPYKLYVANDPGGPVTSQVSNQMNNPNPHIPDVVGLLGPVDNEYAVCPTIDDRCEPPFFTVHFSYEITFQRVR